MLQISQKHLLVNVYNTKSAYKSAAGTRELLPWRHSDVHKSGLDGASSTLPESSSRPFCFGNPHRTCYPLSDAYQQTNESHPLHFCHGLRKLF